MAEDLGYKSSLTEQVKFDYSPLDKVFNKRMDKDDLKEGLSKISKIIENKGEHDDDTRYLLPPTPSHHQPRAPTHEKYPFFRCFYCGYHDVKQVFHYVNVITSSKIRNLRYVHPHAYGYRPDMKGT